MPNYLDSVDKSDWNSLYPDRYADPHTRCYPIHSPESTAASSIVYNYLGGDNTSVIGERIKKACVLFGLEDLMNKIAQVSTPPEPEIYCLPSTRKYPVYNSQHVKVAYEYLDSFHNKFSEEDRKEFSENLLNAQDKYGGLNSEQVHRAQWLAGMGRPLNTEAAFITRKTAAHYNGNEKLYSALCKTEQQVKQGGDGYKAANLLKQVDRLMSWKFEDPTDYLTGLTPQRAKEAADTLVVSKAGNVYNLKDLESVPDNVAVNWGLAAAATLSKKASLLRDGEEGFEEAINEFGVKPIIRRTDHVKIDWDAY